MVSSLVTVTLLHLPNNSSGLYASRFVDVSKSTTRASVAKAMSVK